MNPIPLIVLLSEVLAADPQWRHPGYRCGVSIIVDVSNGKQPLSASHHVFSGEGVELVPLQLGLLVAFTPRHRTPAGSAYWLLTVTLLVTHVLEKQTNELTDVSLFVSLLLFPSSSRGLFCCDFPFLPVVTERRASIRWLRELEVTSSRSETAHDLVS